MTQRCLDEVNLSNNMTLMGRIRERADKLDKTMEVLGSYR